MPIESANIGLSSKVIALLTRTTTLRCSRNWDPPPRRRGGGLGPRTPIAPRLDATPKSPMPNRPMRRRT
eukprot:11221732-Lingulodinium_polyedra.AAC.1